MAEWRSDGREDTEAPTELQLEKISQDAFRSADRDHDQKISWAEFLEYVTCNPEVHSWLDHFDCVLEQKQSPASF